MFRRFWTPELLFPDSIVKCLWISIFKASLEVWNTLDYVLHWAPPSPSQPSCLLRNTAWSPPLPFDLCVRCETPSTLSGAFSMKNKRSQGCLSNLRAPEPNDLCIPEQANTSPKLDSLATIPHSIIIMCMYFNVQPLVLITLTSALIQAHSQAHSASICP